MTSVFSSRHSFSYPRGDQGRGFLSGRVTSLSIHVRTHRVSARRERDYVGRGRGRSLCHVCRREKFASAARIRRPSCATVYLAAAGRNARCGKTTKIQLKLFFRGLNKKLCLSTRLSVGESVMLVLKRL